MEYYEGIISFIDLLGFSRLLNERNCEDVYAILKTFYYFNKNEKYNGDPWLAISNFSDCVIRCVMSGEKHYPMNIPFFEFLNLIHIQGELIHKGIVIRGGITFGKFAFDKEKNLFFGPGIVEAYLQQEKAEFPRLIVDEKVLKQIINDKFFKMPDHEAEYELKEVIKLLRDEKDIAYLDYLKIMFDEVDGSSLYLQLLAEHKKLIEKGLKDRDIYKKYKWMKNYHNEVVIELLKKELRSKYLI